MRSRIDAVREGDDVSEVTTHLHRLPSLRGARVAFMATALATLSALAACAPPPPSTTPEPAVPRPADRAAARRDSIEAAARRDSLALAARDSARARVRLDSVREAEVAAAARRARIAAGRARRIARPSARNDTLAVRELRAPVRVCAGGDVTLGTNLDAAWARQAALRMRAEHGRDDAPATLLAPLRPLVRSADILLLNVESAIGSGPSPSKCGPRSRNCFAFRSPPESAPALRALVPDGVVVGNVANNHARDAGDSGRDITVAALGRAGVLVTGYDTLATPVPTPAGDTIGVLGFYTSTESPDARDTAAVYRHVARAFERYPVVIATMHLGAEGTGAQRTIDARELFLGIDRGNPVAFADAAVRGGAALVIGHGPHVLRAMEWREHGALIAYSLGNLLTYGPFRLSEPLNRGAVLCATIDASGRVSAADVGATVQRVPGVLEADRAGRAAALTDSLGRLDFPATGARVGATGEVRPRAQR